MGRTSRPLIGVLVATVIFAVLWVVALKPGHNNSGGVGQFQPAINAAHAAVSTANNASTTAANSSATGTTTAASASTTPSSTTPSTTSSTPAAASKTSTKAKAKPKAKPAHKAKTVAHAPARPSQTSAQRAALVTKALSEHKVLALLFYNPKSPDDRAVRSELNALQLHAKRLVKLSVPISELSSYSAITTQVPIEQAPTLVIINRQDQASTIVGFSDWFEIKQRIRDALAVL